MPRGDVRTLAQVGEIRCGSDVNNISLLLLKLGNACYEKRVVRFGAMKRVLLAHF